MSTLRYFTHNTLPNCHIELTATGCWVWVSLNVERAMTQFLSPNNIYQRQLLVYALKEHIEVVTTRTVSDCYDRLLKQAMINCREAKMKVLEQQIEYIKN
jgi:hypothetical protein